MRKLFILLAMISLSTFAMAQNPGKNHTKPYNEAKEILEGVMEDMQNAKDCDELDVAVLGVLALLGVEDIDKITEAEEELLSKYTERMDKVLENKKTLLNCEEYDDEDDWEDDGDWCK